MFFLRLLKSCLGRSYRWTSDHETGSLLREVGNKSHKHAIDVFILPPKGFFMTFDLLGKMLFPRVQPWERKRKTKIIVSVLFVALITAGSIGMTIYKVNSLHH